MPDKTTEQLIREVHQAVFGVPNTEAKGFCGDLAEIKKWLKEQNGQYRKLERKFWVLAVVVAGTLGGSGYSLLKLLGD